MEKIKIVLIGEQEVGKTSIIKQFIKIDFNETYQPTIGVDFVCKTLKFNEEEVTCYLWDTAGQERFKSLIPSYLSESNCIFIVYDIAQQNALEKTQQWIDYAKNNCNDCPFIYLIGNKLDQENKRNITYHDGLNLANKNDLEFKEISAKEGSKEIDEIFNEICMKFYQKYPPSAQEQKQEEIQETSWQSEDSSEKNEKEEKFDDEEEKLNESNQAQSHVLIYSENNKEPFLNLALKPGNTLKLFIKNKDKGKDAGEIQNKYEFAFQFNQD